MEKQDPVNTTTRNEEPVSGLVGEERCRKLVWPDRKSRPSSRWFLELKARGLIPFHRIGRRVFYDPAEVRRALDRQFKVNTRN